MTKLVETRKYKSKTLSSIKGCELVFFRDGQETLGERLPSLHSKGNIENINSSHAETLRKSQHYYMHSIVSVCLSTEMLMVDVISYQYVDCSGRDNCVEVMHVITNCRVHSSYFQYQLLFNLKFRGQFQRF